MNPKGQTGFSLLEAVVAMTIIATSGLALFSWVGQSYEALIRLEEKQARHQVMDNLHAYFSTLNVPGETGQALAVNGYDVNWSSSLVEPVQQGRSSTGAPSNFDLGLYDIAIEVRREGRLIGEYSTRLVGYRQVRNVNETPRL